MSVEMPVIFPCSWLTIFLDFLLQIIVALNLLGSRAAGSKPAIETRRIDPVKLSSLLLIPTDHDKTAPERAHVRYLRVRLADVCKSLGDHVGRHLVTVVVFEVRRFVPSPRDLSGDQSLELGSIILKTIRIRRVMVIVHTGDHISYIYQQTWVQLVLTIAIKANTGIENSMFSSVYISLQLIDLSRKNGKFLNLFRRRTISS